MIKNVHFNVDIYTERLNGLETELDLECRITLNGEERWVRNVVIRGEIEDSEYAMIFLRDITETRSKGCRCRCFYCKTAIPFPADGYIAAVYFRQKRKYSEKLSGENVRSRLCRKKDSAG